MPNAQRAPASPVSKLRMGTATAGGLEGIGESAGASKRKGALMPKYIALLRGVNVGQNLLKMDRLRALAEGLGFKDVKTYAQSGNIVFHAEGPAENCSTALEGKLAGETRLPVVVFVRTPAELKLLIERNPFLKDATIDRKKLHVTFLPKAPTKEGHAKLGTIPRGADEFRLGRSEVYLHCPNGYGKTKLSNNAIERALAIAATTRNWNTTTKLLEMVAR
jgi:uncharacterized protein (DUF1697 family)